MKSIKLLFYLINLLGLLAVTGCIIDRDHDRDRDWDHDHGEHLDHHDHDWDHDHDDHE